LIKSEKISEFAKLLEGHMGHLNREKSVEIDDRSNNIDIITENKANEILNIISNKPVVNKKKKKGLRSFSIDE
jgi:hypothetical protein